MDQALPPPPPHSGEVLVAAHFLAQQGVAELSPALIRRVLDELGLAPDLTDEGLVEVLEVLFDSADGVEPAN